MYIMFAGPSAQGRVRPSPRSCLLPPFIPPVGPGPVPPLRSGFIVGPQHHGFCHGPC